MTKHHLNGLFKSYSNHIDPEKEEQLKRVKIEAENQVKKILDLTRTINHGNKERNLRKKSEVIFLIEDFQEQYKSLYSLYEDLREEVKKHVGGADDDSSGSDSDSETYYSPREFSAGNSNISGGTSDSDNQEAENSDLEDTVLKGKLTSSSEVKKSMNLDSEFGGILKDLRIQGEESENTGQRLAQIEDLEGQVAHLKLEISTLSTQKRELEKQVECKFDEAKKMKERISTLEAQVLEIEATSKKNEFQFFLFRKQYKDKEQQYISRISELGAQANNMQLELKTLEHQKGELEGQLAEQYKDKEKQYLSRISELVAQANKMQLELNTLKHEKGKSEARLAEQYNDKEQQYLSRISELVAQASNMQLELNTLKHQKGESEGRLEEQHKDKEKQYLSRIAELVALANNMQLELNTLNHQKDKLEGQLAGETKRWSSQIEGLMEQLNSLQQELLSVNSQKAELERELRKRTEETAGEKESLKVKVNDLELEIQSLSRQKSDLEEEIKKRTHEAFQSNEEKEKLNGKISELQRALSDRDDELSAEQKNSSACQDVMSMKIEEIKNLNNKLVTLEMELEKEKQESSSREDQLKEKNTELTMKIEEKDNLKNKLETLEMELDKEKQVSSLREDQLNEKKTELTNKIALLQEKLLELEAVISKLREENEQAQHKLSFSKSHFQLVERKVEEVAEEFRKQFEDKYRILSRRIRVAEQLHAENKECYLKAKEVYEQETKDLKERAGRTETGLENIKDMTVTANEVLTSLDSVALKFEECTTNFLNRISEASCELKFAKHRAMMKNKADLHVEDKLDLLTSPAS